MNRFLILFIASSFLISCYRSPDDSIFEEDLDMVTTQYTDVAKNNDFKTFYIADSIGLSTNVKDVTIDDVNSSTFYTNIVGSIGRNMRAYGYTQIFKDSLGNLVDTPDIYIPMTVTYINTSGVSYIPVYGGYPGWGWGGYPSYGYGWDYGYGYGGYYYYSSSYIPSYYSYDQGSLHIDWLDLTSAYKLSPNDSVWIMDNVWNLSLNGLVTNNNTSSDRNNRISDGIDQAFEQSPYLNKN